MSRERDIKELCKQVLNASASVYYHPHGPYTITCPFCGEDVFVDTYDLADIEHDTNCGYLIAKDLSTGN